MDARTGYCEGCLRTIEEITAWSRATDPEKRAILACLASRARHVETASPGALAP